MIVQIKAPLSNEPFPSLDQLISLTASPLLPSPFYRCCLQDVNVFVSESDPAVQHDITLAAGRQAYLVCIEGSLAVGTSDSETKLSMRDAAELVADKKPLFLSLTAGEQGAHFMLIEMKQAL